MNSENQITKWLDNKLLELEDNIEYQLDDELKRQEVRRQFRQEFNNSKELIFPKHVNYLNQICNETNAYIIWSSTWRLLEDYQDINKAKQMFNRRGLIGDRLIGYTPSLSCYDVGRRGIAIRTFLFNNNICDYNTQLEKAVILDDRFDASESLPDKCKFFWIDPKIGLTEYETKKIIKYLK